MLMSIFAMSGGFKSAALLMVAIEGESFKHKKRKDQEVMMISCTEALFFDFDPLFGLLQWSVCLVI